MLKHMLLAAVIAPTVLAGCSGTKNRGLESVHQPVVSRTDYVFDVSTGSRGLAAGERQRLVGWFDGLRLGYGDTVAIDDPTNASGGARADVAQVVDRYGIILSNEAPVTGAPVAPGTVRVVVSRARASMPGCPDWSRSRGTDFEANTWSNYGCGVNSNLAAMVANPADLVRGQVGSDGYANATSTRAIETYRKAAPTGGGGTTIKTESTGAGKMNAPWKPGAAHREPFVAYVCDDATAEAIRPIASELGWATEKVNKGGLRNAVQSLSVSASPQVLFVDLAESGDPLNDINALAEVCEPGTVVIASGQVNDVRLYRDLLASGIQDYLLKPLNADMLRDAFTHAQALLNAPKGGEQPTDRPHCSIAVIGTRGGCGASTLATSLSWLLSEKENRSTALLDLDVHFGTGALALDLEPGRGLTDAIENPSRIDGLFIERAMVKASEKLAILSAEAPMNSPIMTDGAAFYQLQEEMRAAFECTVVDLPRGMLVQHPHLISDVQVAVVVTELTLAAARDAIRILSWLKSNAPQTAVFVVANRVPASSVLEISRKDFEGSIERKVDFVVPYDQKLAANAAKLGKPMAEAGKTTKTVAPLADLAGKLCALADGGANAAATAVGKAKGKPGAKAGGSLASKFSGLKGLLAKNDKK